MEIINKKKIIIILFVVLTQFISLNAATKDSNGDCPSVECCYPVKGSEYPPCAIEYHACQSCYWEICPFDISVDVYVTILISNYPFCTFGGQSYEDCHQISNVNDCLNSNQMNNLRSLIIQILWSNNCENIFLNEQGW